MLFRSIFEAAQCRGCHTDDGVASATRVHFPEPNASPDDIEAFGITLAALVDRTDPAQSLLINKPTNRVRHTGGVRIRPGSFEVFPYGCTMDFVLQQNSQRQKALSPPQPVQWRYRRTEET